MLQVLTELRNPGVTRLRNPSVTRMPFHRKKFIFTENKSMICDTVFFRVSNCTFAAESGLGQTPNCTCGWLVTRCVLYPPCPLRTRAGTALTEEIPGAYGAMAAVHGNDPIASLNRDLSLYLHRWQNFCVQGLLDQLPDACFCSVAAKNFQAFRSLFPV